MLSIRAQLLLVSTCLALLAIASSAPAQSTRIWTGGNNNWTDAANWDSGTTAVPIAGDTAQFDDTGTTTNISLGTAAQPIGNIVFDSLSTNTYNLGVLASGDQLNVDSGGSITTSASVNTLQTISATVAGAGPLTFTNNGSGGLTFGDTVTAGSGGTLTLTNTAANSTLLLSGNNTAGALTINPTAGTTTLSGNQTISGATSVSSTGASTINFNGPLKDGTSPTSMTVNITNASAVLNLNAQSTYTGGTPFQSTGAAHEVHIGVSSVLNAGNIVSGPFGTGTITTNSGNGPPKFVAVGGNQTVANAWQMNAGLFFGTGTGNAGQNSITMSGAITENGGRTVTNNIAGPAKLILGDPTNPSTISRTGTTPTLTLQSQGTGGAITDINDTINGTNTITVKNGLTANFNSVLDGMPVTVNRDTTGSPIPQPATANFNNSVKNGNLTVSVDSTGNYYGQVTGTGTITVSAGGIANFNNTVNRSGAVTIGSSLSTLTNNAAVAYFNGPATNTTTVGGTLSVDNSAAAYFNNPLAANGTFQIRTNAVAYINAPATYSGTAANSMNIEQAGTQTALVVNSTVTRTGTATSAVRIATGTLAGNNGTIFAPVQILTSTNGPSYLAPGSPLPASPTNTTPSYKNGAGLLTIGSTASPNTLDFNGTSNCSNCNFYAEIGGTTPGTQYDQVVVNGTATIGNGSTPRGNLTVSLINGYTRPAADTSFEILHATTLNWNGGFAAPLVLPDSNWNVTNTSTSIFANVLGTGDFNGDHVVDAADYVSWRKNDGTAGGYAAFRRNFGTTYSTAANLGAATVPEPSSLALIFLATIALPAARTRRRNRD